MGSVCIFRGRIYRNGENGVKRKGVIKDNSQDSSSHNLAELVTIPTKVC